MPSNNLKKKRKVKQTPSKRTVDKASKVKKKTSKKVSRGRAPNGKGSKWQFVFDKTKNNSPIEQLFWCQTREDFERTFNFEIDNDLVWSEARVVVIENILTTLSRRKKNAQ